MHVLTLLYALAAASPAMALTFGGWPLADCSSNCYKDILGEPALSKCKNTDVLCLCRDYTILGAMSDCLIRTRDCGNNQDRTNTIFNMQKVCDAVIFAAAEASATGSAAPAQPTGDNPPSGTSLAEPTSLQEAEGRLGPSASALINQRPFQLSTGAKAGIAIGSIAGFLLIATIACCCGIYHYQNHVIKKMNRSVNMDSPPAPEYTAADVAAGSDKGTYSSWFSGSSAAGFIKSHTRGATNDTHELGYGFDKELGLMISSSHPRNLANTPTKMHTVDTQGIPQVPPHAMFPQRNPIVAPAVTRSLSTRSGHASKKPVLTVTQSEITSETSSPVAHTGIGNLRMSVQSLRRQQPNDSTSNIPLMFFTPATPQVNVSPVSPSASSISGNGDIFGYYTRDSPTPENSSGSIGVAKSSLDRGTAASPEPYDPISNDAYNRAPSPYTVTATPASPYNNYGLSMDARMPIAGLDLSTEASSRGSTPSPTPRVGLHMPPRYTPYNSTNDRSVSPPLPPLPTTSSPAPPPPSRTPEPADRSTTPTTVTRSNSNNWRLSVERAADKALDKVRSAATAITSTGSNTTGFAQVPEEEEAKSELLNTIEDSRGRRKSKTTPAPKRADSGNPAPRSNSIGQSRSPSGRRTSNAAGTGGYRRSSSLGRYRNRTGSLSYNQIDGVNMPRGRSNRRGSNSSSVMLV